MDEKFPEEKLKKNTAQVFKLKPVSRSIFAEKISTYSKGDNLVPYVGYKTKFLVYNTL